MVVNLLTLCAVIDVRKLTSEAGENELGHGGAQARGARRGDGALQDPEVFRRPRTCRTVWPPGGLRGPAAVRRERGLGQQAHRLPGWVFGATRVAGRGLGFLESGPADSPKAWRPPQRGVGPGRVWRCSPGRGSPAHAVQAKAGAQSPEQE